MGVKGFFHPKIGGGWLFLPTLYIANRQSFAPASRLLHHSQGQKGIESGQKGVKVNIYLLDFVSPRGSRRPKGTKPKHIFGMWCMCVGSCAPLVVSFIVSTGVGVPAF